MPGHLLEHILEHGGDALREIDARGHQGSELLGLALGGADFRLELLAKRFVLRLVPLADRLEMAACECYQIVRAEFDRLLGVRVG